MSAFSKTASAPTIIPRLVVGFVFLSEGIQKILYPAIDGTGRFAHIGFNHPAFWAYFTACFEMTCGVLIILGIITRLACIPLLIIMATAFVTTKLPILTSKGFWPMAHEYRTDFAMTMLLIFLLIYGGGNFSVDKKLYGKRKR